jgi:hypothetical protein
MSLLNQLMHLQNLMSLLRSANMKGFMKGTTLFQWPWRCTTHLGVICIVSSGNCSSFSINDQNVIYPCLFAINFSSIMLILMFNVLESLI